MTGAMTDSHYYVTTTPGLEHVCKQELQQFSQVRDIQCVIFGGLTFRASPDMDFSQLKTICSLNAFVAKLENMTRQSGTDESDTVLER